ncbi:androgen-induced gene 1 protein [Drosophila eugracilis]|uniref:androgen-induced gene 1 protein n=1 Tax=Drosophila eugracilis TaxID=29029 RepID=UPI0007E674C4|nr:androgen-induced gene 1 protein [Drosophila eugracilis]
MDFSIHPEMERGNWSNRARLLLHLSAAVHLGYAIYFDFKFTQLPQLAVTLRLEPPMGGKFKYMTFLSGLVQFGYYTLALTYDILRMGSLRKLRDYMFATLVIPLALTVGLTFWTLYGIDRESIYPSLLDFIYPNWLNHTMHTFVVVYAFVELGITRHRYPKRSRGFFGLGAFMSGYLVWIHYVWFRTGIWVYPFLGGIDWPLRVLFFALIVVLGFVYYLFGEHVNLVLRTPSTGDHKWSGSD